MSETTPPPGESYGELVDAPSSVPVKDEAVPIVADKTLPIYMQPADRWACGPLRVTTSPVQVLGARPNRLRAVLQFASQVYLAPSQEECTTTNGFLTDYAELAHRGDVWAVAASGEVLGRFSAEYVDA